MFPTFIHLSLLATCLLSVPLVAGFFGAWHPAFDSFAHFRVHLAVLILVAALPLIASAWWKHWLLATLLGAAAIVSAVGLPSLGVGPVHAGFEQRPITAKGYRLLHLNLRYDNSRPERVVAMLNDLQPDFVMLNEVSDMWVDRLRDMLNLYPYQWRCGRGARSGGTAILSRHPFGTGRMTECAGDGSLAIAQVELDGRPVDLAALHLGWPWPHGQSRQVTRLAPRLGSLGNDAILTGDLNAVPWSRTARRVSRSSRSRSRSTGARWVRCPPPDRRRSRRASIRSCRVSVICRSTTSRRLKTASVRKRRPFC